MFYNLKHCSEDVQPGEKGCRDSVKIQEGDIELLQRCRETNRPITVTSLGPVLNITLTATTKVFPKRGFLGHFKGEAQENISNDFSFIKD